jgi:AraC-like DNA-binding protein
VNRNSRHRDRNSFGASSWDSPAPQEPEPLRYVLPTSLPGTEFVFAHNCIRRWRVFHESYVVCLCLSASAECLYRGSSHVLSASCAVLMEPGETHVNRRVPVPQTYVVVRILPEVLARAAVELGVPYTPHFASFMTGDPAVRTAFERLAARVASEGSSALEQQSRFAHALRVVLEGCIEPPRPSRSAARVRPTVIERCKTYLREHYDRQVSLDDLAAITRLSRFHLLRSFQKAAGLPPHAYQTRLRIERACRLLQTGMLPSLVASAVGFADQSHLTRHFRRIMYVTPGTYRSARI